ncbi:hypothetical protein [Burkholderia contaminans]|uniref:hypothetical protein n=1 Tax=Burkholderia contaminans TaxID=488447 RepID=UPI001FC8D2E5|nr:hypothetical protein [Burkholderia contaminans]
MTKNKGLKPKLKARPAWVSRSSPYKAADGSILVVRIFGGLMNLDAFFAFSAIRVRFIQVTGRAFSDDQ